MLASRSGFQNDPAGTDNILMQYKIQRNQEPVNYRMTTGEQTSWVTVNGVALDVRPLPYPRMLQGKRQLVPSAEPDGPQKSARGEKKTHKTFTILLE